MESSAVSDHIGGFDLIRELPVVGLAVCIGAAWRSGDQVVLKLLHPHMADVDGCRERFKREAELGLRIHHRNVVSTLASGEDNGVPYLVIEHLDGLPFDTVLKRAGTLPWATALPIAARSLMGSATCIACRSFIAILNRVISTCVEMVAVIIDLGLAKPMADDIDVDLPPVDSDQAWTVTGGAGVMGTPAYMAPEQATDPNGVQPAADIHALGATVFQWPSGDLPRPRCSDPINAMAQLVNRPPDPLAGSTSDLPPAVSAVVDRMLYPEADGRPADGFAAADDIRAPWRACPIRPTAWWRLMESAWEPFFRGS